MKASRLVFWLTPPALTLALYGRVLTFPFYWDDAANFIWMFARPLSDIWVNATGFPFYRPLLFSLWRAMQSVFGQTNTVAFHSLSLLLHTANGWLAGLLAMRLLHPPLRLQDPSPLSRRFATGEGGGAGVGGEGLIVAVLMVAFPFAAPVAPLVASQFHLLVTLFALAALLAYDEYLRRGQLRWAVAAVSLAALSPFVHESGVTVGALLALWACLRSPELRDATRHAKRSFVIPLLALLLNGLFLPWWTSVPKTRSENFAWVGWGSVRNTTAFFMEGLTFPIQFIARPLTPRVGGSDVLAVGLLAALAIGLSVLVLRHIRTWQPLAFGLAYTLIGGAPSIFGLPYSYIVVSPRLLVYTSPGAAVLWAGAIAGLSTIIAHSYRHIRPNTQAGEHRSFAIASVFLTVALLAVPVAHIARSTALHALALRPVWQMAEAVRAHPAERQLFVNPTNWIADVKATYAIGHEGVEVMAGYLTPQMMARVHTRTISPVEGMNFPLVNVQLADHYFEAWGAEVGWETLASQLPNYDRVWVLRYSDKALDLQEVGWMRPEQQDASSPPVAVFGDRLRLEAAAARVADDRIQLELDWYMLKPSGEDIFAHAFDCGGNVLGLTDGAGLGGVYPIWLWRPGDRVHDVRSIPLSEPSPDGCYIVEVGLFDPATGARTPARDKNGNELENDVVVLKP